MVEDALKAARNLHRLMIGVSLITIVFALSMDLPEDKVAQIAALESLKNFPFLDYETYATEKVNEFHPAFTSLSAATVKTSIEKLDLMTFHLDRIGDAFQSPAHVGKLQSNDLVFSNIQSSSLTQLEAVSGALDIESPVQVWVSNVDEIVPELERFLLAQLPVGGRIDNVILDADVDMTGQSFVPGDNLYANLYFEWVPPPGGAASRPVFTLEFSTTLHEIPNSDWKSWLLAQSGSEKIVKEENGELIWLPEIKSRPDGFEQKEIGLLIADLTRDLNESSPESQKISLLGTEIPGILMVYASPLILLALAYYFFNHLCHLRKLTAKDKEAFGDFAWMLLSLDKRWIWEAYASLVALPGLSVLLLNYRLSVFQTSRWLPIVVAVLSLFFVVYLGFLSIRQLRTIRSQLVCSKNHREGES